MAVLTTTTKAKVAAKGAKGVAQNPGIAWIAAKATRPAAKAATPAAKLRLRLEKRRARRRTQHIGRMARNAATELITYGPQAAQELGLVKAPKPKKTAPRVAAGVVIGAGTVYAIDHREEVMRLVS